MPDREPRTSITLSVSAAQLVDKLPTDHPAFNQKCANAEACTYYRRCTPCRVSEKARSTWHGVNRSARLEALAYAAGSRVASPKPRAAAKAAKKPKGA